MKSLLQVIMILSGTALIIGSVLFIEGYRGIGMIRGTAIIGMFLIPFVCSLGFNVIIDILERQAQKRESWFEAMNYNLLEIRKKYLKEEDKK